MQTHTKNTYTDTHTLIFKQIHVQKHTQMQTQILHSYHTHYTKTPVCKNIIANCLCYKRRPVFISCHYHNIIVPF